MLAFDEARSKLLRDVSVLGPERVALALAAGRVLAEELRADGPWPPSDASAMDGYAVRVADFAGDGPWSFPVVSESRAGRAPSPLARGTVMRIFTGAIVPEGADAVVMQEFVTREGDRAVFAERPKIGQHIRRAGEDMQPGDEILAVGTRLDASKIALAASLDRAELVVSRRPIVTVLATGDELRPPGSKPSPATIPESNGVGITILASRAAAIAHVLPITADEPDAMDKSIRAALRSTDVLVTIGGVSVGDHDVVKPALERAGVRLDFWKVAIKPGKPIAVGRAGDTYVIGLPGNPVSAMVTFALFGMPLLRALQGDRSPLPSLSRARLGKRIERQTGRLELSRVSLSRPDGDLPIATPLANQASGALAALARSDGLAFFPAEAAVIDEGTVVDVLRLDDA